jgi:small-conductance mechanosensitive channel
MIAFLHVLAVEGLLTNPKRWRAFKRAFVGFEWDDLLWSVGAIAVGLVAGRLVAALITRAVDRWARKFHSAEGVVRMHLGRPLRWLAPTLGVQLMMPVASLPKSVRAWLDHALLIVAIVSLGWALLGIVRVLEEVVQRSFERARGDDQHARRVQTQFRGFRNIASFLIVLVTFAFVLITFDRVRQLGAGLLASAGVAGIVIGFAAQRSLSTLLAGIQIALSQPIRVGDSVTVEGEFGTVEEITLTYVVIRLWDLRRQIVPVSHFIEKPFQNWTRTSSDVLGAVLLPVDYGVPVEPLREELKRILEASPYWDRATWGLQVTDATERSKTVRALVSAKTAGEVFDLRCEVREKLIDYLAQHHPLALPKLRIEPALE